MDVAGLRDPCPERWLLWWVIALDDRHLVEAIGEHAGSQQSGQAGADHHRTAPATGAVLATRRSLEIRALPGGAPPPARRVDAGDAAGALFGG
jgi:hypothetical protein